MMENFGEEYLNLKEFQKNWDNEIKSVGYNLDIPKNTVDELVNTGYLSINNLPHKIKAKIPMSNKVLLNDNTVWEYEFVNKKAKFYYLYTAIPLTKK